MFFSPAAILSWIMYYKYIILIPATIIEGPIVTVLCGILVSRGIMEWWIVYILVMLGDLIGDIIWYWLGYHFGHRFVKRFGARFGITEPHIAKVKEQFHTHQDMILFFSKVTSSFGLAIVVLFTAGLSRINFSRYMIVNTAGQFVWSGMLLASGYFFGDILSQIESIFGKITLIILVIIVVIIGMRYTRKASDEVLE